MDKSIDPFADFYNYSCGNWIRRHEIPADKTQIGSFYELNDANLEILKGIVESCAKRPSKELNSSKVGNFYKSFMDESKIEKLRFKPLGPTLRMIRDMKGKDELPVVLAGLSRQGIMAFFSVYVSEDPKNSSIYALSTWQGGISLPDRDYYTDDRFKELRKKYRDHLARIFVHYGSDRAYASKNADAVMHIETELAKAQRSNVELRDEIKNYNKMSFKQVTQRYDRLGIADFYNGIGAKNLEYVIVGQPEFLDKSVKLISSLSIDQIKAYLTWKVLHGYSGLMHKKFYDEEFEFFGKALLGSKKPRPRWKRGIGLIDSLIGEALGKLYVEREFGAETKSKAETLVSDIIDSFRERLKAVDWMGPETKRKAIEKLDAITKKIGYPKKFRDYSKLDIRRDDLVGNVQRAVAFEFDRDIRRIGKRVDKLEWGMTPPTVNAYYDPSKNEIVFPAGIFQPPFFDPKQEDAVNYASIGGVMGHEMTHGFDDQGSRYDKNGNLKEWWSKTDRARFNSRARKVADLYSSIKVIDGMKVNGKLTLGENIADIGGIRIAYDALQKSLKRDPEKRKLVDGFTPEQIFFIAWAQLWKGRTRPAQIKRLLLIDPHSPQKVRGSVPVLTHPGFEKAFKGISKMGKPLKAYEKVNLW